MQCIQIQFIALLEPMFQLSVSAEDFGKTKKLMYGCEIKFRSLEVKEDETCVIQFRSGKNMGKLADLLEARKIDFEVSRDHNAP